MAIFCLVISGKNGTNMEENKANAESNIQQLELKVNDAIEDRADERTIAMNDRSCILPL